MAKISTHPVSASLTSKKTLNAGRQNESQVGPAVQTIRNILAFSKALSIEKSSHIGVITSVMN